MHPVLSRTPDNRPQSPTYAVWQLWDKLLKSGRLQALSNAEILVLQSLVHHCRTADWVTWVSVDTLTSYLPVARSTVQRALRTLERKRFIVVEERPGRSSLIGLDRQLLADLHEEGQRDAAPEGPQTRHQRGRISVLGGSVVRPEQSKENRVTTEQQAEPAQPEPVADAASEKIDLPDDLVEVAATQTVGKPLMTQLVAKHGLDVVREALTAIQQRYDAKGVAVANRGGMLRRAVEQCWQPLHQPAAKAEPVAKPLNRDAVVARVMAIRFNPDGYSIDEKRQALLDACSAGEAEAAGRLAAAWGIDLNRRP